MTTPRERALDRLIAFSPRLHQPGDVIEELITAWEACEVGRDLITEYRLGAGVSWEKLQAALLVLDERKP